DPWEGISSLQQELASGPHPSPLPSTGEGTRPSPSTSRVPSPATRERARVRADEPAPRPTVPPERIQRPLPNAVVPSRDALTAYWKTVAKDALVHLARRPLKLVRHVAGQTFFHQGALPPVPDAVHQLRIETRAGGEGVRLWVDSLDGLLGLLEIGVVELHAWGATTDDIERPDLLAFALEPDEANDWAFVT